MSQKVAHNQQDDILESLKMQARKLAILLQNSNMPEDIKESWIAMLPSMSLEQIERLLNILEAKFIDQQTKGVDEKFKNKLKVMVEEYKKKDFERDKKLLEQIKSLEI